jgi:SAM-dependent methyltransferase
VTVQREARDSKAFFYPESRFGGFTDSDSQVVFYTRVHSLLSPEAVVLDIGCGRGRAVNDPVPARRQLRTLKGKCRRVIGIDVDPAAAANTEIDEFRAIEPGAARWPVDDGMIDLALSISVLEHVCDPEHFFAECRRVIKPGGFLCLRTTNAWSYSGIAARLIPNRYHAAVIRRVYAHPRGAEDVFSTVYRCNTVFKLRRTLSRFGFDHCVYGYQSQPSSLAFSRFFYFWGVMHQRLAPNVIKPTLFAFAQKNTSKETA